MSRAAAVAGLAALALAAGCAGVPVAADGRREVTVEAEGWVPASGENLATIQHRALAEAQKLAALVQKLDEAITGMEGEVADELLALGLEVARQVVRETVRLQPEAILAVVKEALLQLPHQHAMVFLHPDDAALVRIHLGDQLAHAGHRIQDDPALARGDCQIEAGNTRVDATLENRWQRVVAGLGGTLQLNAPEVPQEDA